MPIDAKSRYFRFKLPTTFQIFDAILSLVQVVFPILPILACSITSTSVLILSKRVSKRSNTATKLKNDATITIIWVTVIYILCNIPAVLNYAQHVVAVYTGRYFLFDTTSEGRSAYVFLSFYTWIYSFILMVALNSLANPLLYALRMRRFRSDSNRVRPQTWRLQTIRRSLQSTEN